MGIFRRKKADDHHEAGTEPDAYLPPLTRADAAHLTALARDAFAAHGVPTEPHEGVLVTPEGRTFGLGNVSMLAASAPREEWPAMLAEHAQTMTAPVPTGADAAPEQIFARLMPIDQFGPDHHPTYDAIQPVPGVVAVIAQDLPDRVASVMSLDDLGHLGDADALYRLAISNIEREVIPQVTHEAVLTDEDEPGSELHVFTGESFFTASLLFVLPQLLASVGRAMPEHGALVAMPSRHMLVVHLPSGPGTLSAANTMAPFAAERHDDMPGPIAPFVFHLTPDQRATQFSFVEDNKMTLKVDGPIEDMFRAVGLLGT
jgi:hypothetical protein